MMKKPLILFAAIIFGFVAFAQTGPELIPPKLGDAEDQKRYEQEREAYLKASPSPDLQASPKPPEPEKLKVWGQCQALSKEVSDEYKYVEGELLSKKVVKIKSRADCFPPCEQKLSTDNRKNDIFYITFKTPLNPKLTVSFHGSTSELNKLSALLIEENKYIFCAKYDPVALKNSNKKTFLVDHLETFQSVGE